MSNPQFSKGKKWWPLNDLEGFRCEQLHRHGNRELAEECDQQHQLALMREHGLKPEPQEKPRSREPEQLDLPLP